MITTHRKSALVALGLTSCLVGACVASSTQEGSVFDDEASSTPPAVSADPSKFDPTRPPPGVQPACAVTSALAKLTPVNLVLAYDRSGSMGDTKEDPSFDPAKRWLPVGRAMKAFFADPSSVGMRASLTFFPANTNVCDASAYATSLVPETALPSAAFEQAIDEVSPRGNTPTRAAVAGALVRAQAIAAQRPSDKTVIVLVTDGEPYGCGVQTVSQSNAEALRVAADVAAGRGPLALYVVGVGPSVQNLDAVAVAGGTTAFHVQVGTAEETGEDLLAAMKALRGELGPCAFDVPPAPDGRTIDPKKVNVEVLAPGQPVDTLPHRQDCAGGVGWHWDDASAPKKVLLCPQTCNAVAVEAGGRVTVSYGCVDRPDVIR